LGFSDNGEIGRDGSGAGSVSNAVASAGDSGWPKVAVRSSVELSPAGRAGGTNTMFSLGVISAQRSIFRVSPAAAAMSLLIWLIWGGGAQTPPLTCRRGSRARHDFRE
jgi:hypothetical protein